MNLNEAARIRYKRKLRSYQKVPSKGWNYRSLGIVSNHVVASDDCQFLQMAQDIAKSMLRGIRYYKAEEVNIYNKGGTCINVIK